jgi:hypothetical protein
MTLLAQFAATGGGIPQYIEDVFSTWLYTGTGATQTITNGIDLAGKGGMTWVKSRTSSFSNHCLFDTVRGALNDINSNTTDAQASLAGSLTAFNANGFSIGNNAEVNTNTEAFASWTFRDQAKFFDVVTYTGTGANRTVAHALGSVPGCIMVKRTNATSDWQVYHRSLANTEYMVLNGTAVAATGATRWNSTTPTDAVFSLGTDATVNASGGTYVAYIFAHNAGGFGLSGADNVISCGSFTTDGSGNATVSLGYEPQWVLYKASTGSASNWFLFDTMRGWANSPSQTARLITNATAAEAYVSNLGNPNATGFSVLGNTSSTTFIYITIRRGPMRTPTTGTSVFAPVTATVTGSTPTTVTTNFPVDLTTAQYRPGNSPTWFDRLRGGNTTSGIYLFSDVATAEAPPQATGVGLDSNTTLVDAWSPANIGTGNYIYWNFRRAPSFFDEVCYTGTGNARTLSHNLTVAPELMIVKGRSGSTAWQVYSSGLLNTEYLVLNTTAAKATGATRWNSTTPTASVFSLGTATEVNTNGATYVAYLFASCPGVSKVGSYTGTGTTQVINCGFTTGARYVLIKRADSTGDWYVWDTARGMIPANDPYLLLNSAAAEVTGTDFVDTAATGFEISSTAPAAINANGGTFIFLAIA